MNIFNEIIDNRESKSFEEHQQSCFLHFDDDRDGYLNFLEFCNLCKQLFCNAKLQAYSLKTEFEQNLFNIFDKNKDGKIDDQEFSLCWKKWIKKVLFPVNCFLAVDVQNDFISGSLALKNCPAKEDGIEILPVINNLISSVKFDCFMYSLDWHPEDHISFVENINLRKFDESSEISQDKAKLFDTVIFQGPPKMEQKLWPTHCVQNSWGSHLHDDLKIAKDAAFIHKGTRSEIDSYSAFWDNSRLFQTSLCSELNQRNVSDVYICGLAYDVCVGSTAKDSLEMGFRTIIIEDGCKGVIKEDIHKTKECLCCDHAVVVSSNEVDEMVKGKDRRPELAYFAALLLT